MHGNSGVLVRGEAICCSFRQEIEGGNKYGDQRVGCIIASKVHWHAGERNMAS